MKRLINHPFHLVDTSPWPIVISINLMSLMVGILQWMQMMDKTLLMMSLTPLLLTMFQWWRDINRESTYQGKHTIQVQIGLKLGMMLFILSEIMFFLSFFWSYFHASLSPSHESGLIWPPTSIITFDPMSMPLLNTMILLCSGMTITWSHFNMISNNMMSSQNNLLITILLGMYFTTIQMYEYFQAPFSLSDGIYGSVFFMMTGFHGFHVIIGTCFLITCWMQLKAKHLTHTHHLGFELCAWYWHFVDIVWLMLFVSIYWWGK
uniref:Cytochrome c oxidase subunit 3 n=1 Tax=Hackeriella veitchi TaxID=60873 RepID=L7N6K4_9HEMI|nr:cytochrome c oxidase subunit III [Hackeriella veitchi]ACV96705.1 cytochrome c oxidase subunit III [Hackeriella veitchi]